MKRQVILASASKQRNDFFSVFGIPFVSIPANLDEKSIQDINPKVRTEKVARAKAEKIAEKYTGVIIAADTFIVHDQETLEKPETKEEAKHMLEKLSDSTAEVYTGFCYLDKERNINFSTAVVITTVFRNIGKKEIDTYITRFPVLTWSGAFSPAYPYPATFIAAINGSYTGFTYGLPIEYLIPLLRQSEISF